MSEEEARAWAAHHEAHLAAVEQSLEQAILAGFPPFVCPEPSPAPEPPEPLAQALSPLLKEAWCTNQKLQWWESRNHAASSLEPLLQQQLDEGVIGLELRVGLSGADAVDGYALRAGAIHFSGLREERTEPEQGLVLGEHRLGWGQVWRPDNTEVRGIVMTRQWAVGPNDLSLRAVMVAESR